MFILKEESLFLDVHPNPSFPPEMLSFAKSFQPMDTSGERVFIAADKNGKRMLKRFCGCDKMSLVILKLLGSILHGSISIPSFFYVKP